MHEFYTIRMAAKIIGHPVRTVRYWVTTGQIKAIKAPNSRQWLIPRSEIERYVEDYADVDEHIQYPG